MGLQRGVSTLGLIAALEQIAIILRRHRLRTGQHVLGALADTVGRFRNQVAEAPLIFPCRDEAGDALGFLDSPFEGFQARQVGAAQNNDPGFADLAQHLFECGFRVVIEQAPSLAFHDTQYGGLVRGGRRRRARKPGAARIAAGAAGDFISNLPHVLDAMRVHTVRALTGRLTFAAVNRALARFQGHVAAETRRADDRSADLGSDRGRHHACADRGGRAGG